MSSFLLLTAALTASILVFVILIQNPKTGAFDATFNTRQLIGGRQSNKIAEKTTWGMVTLMFVLCLVV